MANNGQESKLTSNYSAEQLRRKERLKSIQSDSIQSWQAFLANELYNSKENPRGILHSIVKEFLNISLQKCWKVIRIVLK